MDIDSAEEQANELVALEAIFDEDFTILEQPEPGCTGARFQVDLDDSADPDLKVRLIFTHTPNYPVESLLVNVQAISGVSSPRRKQLQAHLESVVQDNPEIPVVYVVCEAAREWLSEHVVGKVDDDEEATTAKFETLDSTQRDQVEVISSKAVGTPVTVESFTEWQAGFLIEIQAKKTQLQLEREANKKPTGREFFESRNMVVSAESESFWEAEADQLTALQ